MTPTEFQTSVTAQAQALTALGVDAYKLAEYREALKRFDWFYEFSDCHQTYCKGRDALRELTAMQREIDPDGSIWREYQPKRHGAPGPSVGSKA